MPNRPEIRLSLAAVALAAALALPAPLAAQGDPVQAVSM